MVKPLLRYCVYLVEEHCYGSLLIVHDYHADWCCRITMDDVFLATSIWINKYTDCYMDCQSV